MGEALTNFANQSKERIQNIVEKITLADQQIFRLFIKENAVNSKRYEFHSDKYIIPVVTGRGSSARAVGENEAIPPDNSFDTEQMTTKLAVIVSQDNVSFLARQVGNNQAYIEKSVDRLQKNLIHSMQDAHQIQLIGYPVNGAIAKVKSYSSGTLLLYRDQGTYTGAGEPGTKYVRSKGGPTKGSGPAYVFGDSSGTISGSAAFYPSSVDSYEQVTGTSGITGISDGDYMYPGDLNSDQAGNSIVGLRQHVRGATNAASDTYQGLSSRGTSYPELCSHELLNGGTPRSLSQQLLWQALDRPGEVNDADSPIDLLLTTPVLHRAWADLYDAMVEFRGGEAVHGINHRDAKYDGIKGFIKTLIDRNNPVGQIMLLASKTFRILYADKIMRFETDNNGDILQKVGAAYGTYLKYTAIMTSTLQMVCENPSQNVVLGDLIDAPVSGLV
jgi:hypothetical protein